MEEMRLVKNNSEPRAGEIAGPETERFRKIRELFESALEMDPALRSGWLHEACKGDGDLCQ
jgi:hypothetical protein